MHQPPGPPPGAPPGPPGAFPPGGHAPAPAPGALAPSILDQQITTQVQGRYWLTGEIAQVLGLELAGGQNVWASKGSILAHDPGVAWQLKIPGAALSRMLSGEGLAMTYLTCQQPGAQVLLTANSTGKIAVWDLAWGPVTCTSGSFLAAIGNVDINVTVARRAGAAIFGGAGLLLQKISGQGLVFIHGAGDFTEKTLVPGQSITVSTGNLAAFSSGAGYDIVGVGGCIKALFGSEGLFMTRMTGPGKVLLQSMKKMPGKVQGA